jgi:hypothetical protein
MVEMPGSEKQIMEIIFLVNLNYVNAYYRKTKDTLGEDYFLILDAAGNEVAEWDDDTETWILLPHPRPTGNIFNTTLVSELGTRIEKQFLNMSLCEGKLLQLSGRYVPENTVTKRL